MFFLPRANRPKYFSLSPTNCAPCTSVKLLPVELAESSPSERHAYNDNIHRRHSISVRRTEQLRVIKWDAITFGVL
eukprot:1012680-Pleurochrysis_carterae.AAC.1